MPTPIYLIQRFSDGSSSTETRYVRHTAMMDGHSYRNALLDEIPTWVSTFPEPQVVVPVGNVPFVQAWAQAVGKHLPNPETYPDALRPFLHRRVEHKTLEEALAMQHGFIKPVQVKTFDGFVLGNQTEHAQEQMGLCQALPPDTPVWWSDPVRFGAEFRCYFANTTKRDKNSFDFTMNWAKADNSLIKDLKDFTATFFQKNTLLNVLLKYSVFDVSDNLLIMRPYQIAATERILWKIESSYQAKNWRTTEAGGYIWHTTGSGKTLTSFKAARLATDLDFIDKVFFVVDRKDLDYQTIKEYQRFSPDSVNGSDSTAGLKRNIEKDDNKIIVTTIQNEMVNRIQCENSYDMFMKLYYIFDEVHAFYLAEKENDGLLSIIRDTTGDLEPIFKKLADPFDTIEKTQIDGFEW